jgi:hypothetical protein
MFGLNEINEINPSLLQKITIFNIDTFRPNFRFPSIAVNPTSHGYLEVFEGEGENWSFAKLKSNDLTLVCQTAEKNPISNLCSTGLYQFSSFEDYVHAYTGYLSKPKTEWEKGELYIAPLYNVLIESGYDVHVNIIQRNEVIFCGVPNEYIEFLNDK